MFVIRPVVRAITYIPSLLKSNSLSRGAGLATMAKKRDPNTLSNYHEILTTQLSLNFDIDFKKKQLAGNVIIRLKSLAESGVKTVILDTSFLDISKIEIDKKSVDWSVADREEPYGSPLTIVLSQPLPKDEEINIDIHLSTTEKCTALQWLEPEQTPNKKHPYMFSQCQAIHARSIFPCQDTPDVKAPVFYSLRSPLQVLASGHFEGENHVHGGHWDEAVGGTKGYKFDQQIPIPSYLVAIASGDLVSAPIGPRSLVWTGPDELEGCRWELDGDMEKFVDAAEELVFKYAWGTYNVLVLPNSFPYGGMENPVYTFATPTIISKDKQNIDVIAHELSHSWSGNLVSNGSWEHFWLNEGWTTYLERRIQGKIHGEPHRDFSAIIGWKALTDSIERFGTDHEFTKLVIDLEGKDPDDAFSSVPYEKGFTFLYYLEKLVGIETWDRFIPHYFETWKFKSLDSFEFKKTLLDFFSNDKEASGKLKEVDWDTWFYKPGYPPKPNFDESMVRVCYELADKWRSRAEKSFEPKTSDIEGWIGNQSVVFLEKLQSFPSPPLRSEDVRALGETYGYAASSNVELVSRFYGLGLMVREKSVYKPTADLLGTVGRMKFVRPLYRLLNECDRDLAVATFEENKTFYHPICRAMVEKDLFGDK